MPQFARPFRCVYACVPLLGTTVHGTHDLTMDYSLGGCRAITAGVALSTRSVGMCGGYDLGDTNYHAIRRLQTLYVYCMYSQSAM